MGMLSLKRMVDHWNMIQLTDDDVMIGVTGAKGVGKSSLSVGCAMEIVRNHNRLHDKKGFFSGRLKFNMRRNLPYTNSEVIKAAQERDFLDDYSPVVIDEAIKASYKRDFAKLENKDLIKEFTVNRPRHLISFWLIPEFTSIDRDIQSLLDFHLMVLWKKPKKYAVVLVFERDKNPLNKDPWEVKKLEKIMQRMPSISYTTSQQQVERVIKLMENLKTFVGYMRVKPLPEKLYSRYKQVRQDGVYRRDLVGKEGSPEDINSRRLKVIGKNLTKLIRKRGDKAKLYRILCKDEKGEPIMTINQFYQIMK